jgi:hypothetical protein
MLSATPLDAYDIQLLWADLPIISSGDTILFSTDPTFSTGVTNIISGGGVTDNYLGGLSPSTTYYFEIEADIPGTPIIGTASATTPASDGDGGTLGPTAPTITQAAESSQPTPTTLSLTMAASSAAGDPISYSWQLVSGPGGPPPAFTNSEQTTTVSLSAAGDYEFQCTATDDSDMLAVSSDTSIDVNQTASSIQLSYGNPAIPIDGASQFTATELDQFGNAMAATFDWSVANGGGSISATSPPGRRRRSSARAMTLEVLASCPT